MKSPAIANAVGRLTLGLSILGSLTIAQAAIVSVYHFDETSGTTAADSAGSFNGTLSAAGSSFVGGGISGNAISLERAQGGFVNMGTSFPAFTSGNFSISFWVKTTSTEADSLFLSQHKAGTQNGYFVALNTTGGGGALNKATFVAGNEFVSQGATSSATVNDGVWRNLVAVYQSGGARSIYVDGLLSGSTPSSAAFTLGAPFLIGGVREIVGTNNPESRYTGLIDEVQVYDHALSSTEITYLYQNSGQVVPEPSASGLLAGGALLIALRRRRSGRRG